MSINNVGPSPSRPAAAKRPTGPSLASITSSTKKLPNRVMLHAVQKWGKTSWAAQAPNPVFVCTKGEDGLMTLIDSGRLPPTPHYPDCMTSWNDMLGAVEELATGEHQFRTVVIDTINGAERLCHEDLCRREFGNDWGKEGFLAFGQGPKSAVPAFTGLLSALDKCRERGMGVIVLAHSAPRTAKNPEGIDYEKWETVLERPTASVLTRWADMILFGAFEVATRKDGRRAKASGQTRMIRCEADARWEAGNRHGLPAEIDGGDSAAEAWSNFATALKAARMAMAAAETAATVATDKK